MREQDAKEMRLEDVPKENRVIAADPWVHRSSGMRCGTCIWFVEKQRHAKTVAPAERIGRCRRHAPTMGGYPVVYISDWCGDHRLDENKA